VSKRYPEIDLLRTVAILCMVIFHGAYDLAVFHDRSIDVFGPAWTVFARLTAGLFLVLAGISFAVSASRKKTARELWKRQLRRFGTIGCAALAISIGTYLFDPDTYVRFGILHLIALSMLLLPIVRPLKGWSIIPGVLMLCFGLGTRSTDILQPLSMIVGFPPTAFASVDYFPLLPWFGTVLIGFGIGHLFYVRSTAWRENLPDEAPSMLTWPGRHSLLLYIIHQPILLLLLWLLLQKY